MLVAITGFSYLLMSLGLGGFALRFFQSWKITEKETGKGGIGQLLFYFLSLFALICFLAAIGGIFFSENSQVLRQIVIITSFLLSLACAVGAYLIIYLRFRKVKPWTGFSVIFLLGVITTIITIFIPSQPFLEETGGINWDFQFPVYFLRFFLYLFTFPFLGSIFFQQFLISKDREVKIKSFGLGLIFLFGFLIAFMDFILKPIFKFEAINSDILTGILGTVLIICFILPLISKGNES